MLWQALDFIVTIILVFDQIQHMQSEFPITLTMYLYVS